MAVGPRIIAPLSMADIRSDSTSRAPGRLGRGIKIAIIPPEQSGSSIQPISVHARCGGLSDTRSFHTFRFLEITKVNVVVSVPAISLAPRNSVELRIFQVGGGTGDNFVPGIQIGYASRRRSDIAGN